MPEANTRNEVLNALTARSGAEFRIDHVDVETSLNDEAIATHAHNIVRRLVAQTLPTQFKPQRVLSFDPYALESQCIDGGVGRDYYSGSDVRIMHWGAPVPALGGGVALAMLINLDAALRKAIDACGDQWLLEKPQGDVPAGRWPRRMAKLLKRGEYAHVDFAQALAGEGVEIKKTMGVFDHKLTMRVQREIDWDKGDFGDRTSCYWESEWPAKPLIARHPETFVITVSEHDRGVARCWGIYDVDKGRVFITNAYGAISEQGFLNVFKSYLGGAQFEHASIRNSRSKYPYVNKDKIVALSLVGSSTSEAKYNLNSAAEDQCDGCGYVYDHCECSDDSGDYYD